MRGTLSISIVLNLPDSKVRPGRGPAPKMHFVPLSHIQGVTVDSYLQRPNPPGYP